MSMLQDPIEKRRGMEEYRDDFIKSYRRTQGPLSPKSQVEQEKRVRREIANSNERRRMQSINSGFEEIRRILPPPQEGEKYSKATILQLAVKYIHSLETEANRLATQLKMLSSNSNMVNCTPVSSPAAGLLQTNPISQNNTTSSAAPPRKRKIEDAGSPLDIESLKRRTLVQIPSVKSYDDLSSENNNLRQHLGQVSSARDCLQREIECLRQQMADIASAHQGDSFPNNGSSTPSTCVNSTNNTTMTAYSLQTRLPPNQSAVQMTIHSQSPGPKNSFQVQKIFANQQQLAQTGALLAQHQVQHLSHDASKLKLAGQVQQQQPLQHHLNQLPQNQQQHRPPQQPLRQHKQQEIIHLPLAAAAANVNHNISKPGFEQFAIDPGSAPPAATVSLTRSSESASPQPLTLTPATPVENVLQTQATFPKKSLDALVLAIQQIEGTSMGSTPEDIDFREKCESSVNELDLKSTANSNSLNNVIANNNNNNNNDDKMDNALGVPSQPPSAYHPSPQPLKPESSDLSSNIANPSLPHQTLEGAITTTPTSATFPVVTAVTISTTDSVVKCEPAQSSELTNPSNPTTSEEYPIVTKLLNRPIPHKYLHRPQVVVNSSH